MAKRAALANSTSLAKILETLAKLGRAYRAGERYSI